MNSLFSTWYTSIYQVTYVVVIWYVGEVMELVFYLRERRTIWRVRFGQFQTTSRQSRIHMDEHKTRVSIQSGLFLKSRTTLISNYCFVFLASTGIVFFFFFNCTFENSACTNVFFRIYSDPWFFILTKPFLPTTIQNLMIRDLKKYYSIA